MKEKWQHITEAGACPDVEKLMLYQEGKLAQNDRFTIENHLAGCDMCNDVIEGYSLLKSGHSLFDAERDIKARLDTFVFPESKFRISPIYRKIMAAAGIILILSIGTVIYTKMKPSKPDLAVLPKMEKKETQSIQTVSNYFVSPNKEKSSLNNSSKKVPDHNNSLQKAKTEARNNDKIMSGDYINETKSGPETEIITIENEKSTSSSKDSCVTLRNRAISEAREIIGLVKDKSGQPLPGVSISVKGTNKVTLTDADGKFKIKINPSDKELVVKCIGFNMENISLANNSKLDVTLNEEVNQLDEVVVIGYGVQKKRAFTGAISSVSMDKKNKKANISKSKSIANSPIETQKELASLDSLKESSKNDPENQSKIKLLTEKYLELQNQNEALEQLRNLQLLTSDPTIEKKLNKIIQLVQNRKFSKALRLMREN